MLYSFKKVLLCWQFIFFIAAIVITTLFSWAYINYNSDSYNSLRFQDALNQKSIEANNFTSYFVQYLDEDNEWKAIDTALSSKPIGVDILVYKKDSLCCWTSPVLPFQNEDVSLLQGRVVKLANTWYSVQHQLYREWDVYNLVSIKTEYSFKNSFLEDEYAEDLPLMRCKEISLNKNASGEKVYDIYGNYLFTALKCTQSNLSYALWGIFFFFLSMLFYIQLVVYILKKQQSVLSNNLLYMFNVFFVILFYLIHIHYQFPSILFSFSLFSPVYFGATVLFPNLGSLLLFAIIVFSESFIFFRYVRMPAFIVKPKERKFFRNIVIGLMIALAFVFWHLQNGIVSLLVSNSVSAAILFKVSNLQFFDIVRFFIISLLWLSALLVMEKIVAVFLKHVTKKVLSLIAAVVAFTVSLYSFDLIFWMASLMFLVIANMLIWITRRKSYHAYTTFIWFVGVFSLYGLYSFYYHNYNKERDERKLLVENLSFRLLQEEDPLSEMLLKEMEGSLKTDSFLLDQVLKENIDVEMITQYLKTNYFQGYLERFDLQVVPCWPGGELYIDTDNVSYNCYDYFDRMLTKSGVQVMGSEHFYFLKNQGGIVTYFGVFRMYQGDVRKETCLFIELVAKPYFEGRGYPELLLSERESKLKEPLVSYSYAKYVDGMLVKQVGDFAYPIHKDRLVNNCDDHTFFNSQDFSHICYYPQENTCILLSLPNVTFSMFLVAFSILFVAFFIFGSLLILVTRLRRGRFMYDFTVQERIQIAIVSLMMFLLFVIASGSVWQTVRRFEVKNNQMLSEKTKSILLELNHEIGSEKELNDEDQEYLEYLLKKFSSVYYTDLNLYGTNGRLIASSRPELFDKGLSGHLMNSRSYIELNRKEEVEFIHQESIGNLKYLSVYVPYINENNKVLAYLNMPYFIGTSELREEISSLVMAIINFYLIFLVVVIGLTVVISRRITYPLKVIQSKMGEISLGQRNEKIEYKGNDEIGQLVTEYNRMVDELVQSAEKLAKSEREMAWREMARQIAHEIKNPLTPMKLSIQYLERARQNNDNDFDEKLKRVSSTLIDQIDKLSSIASEFSNFASMPIAKRKKLDVIKVLTRCVSLFDKTNKVNINIDTGDIESYFIYADNEQMISVFNNLLQNAIQSIPSKREGEIIVGAKADDSGITITISDNGVGITEEVQKKLFAPNFTTKSSGMGLGLAIVKNIVVNSNGKIWFKTKLDKGTVFYVSFVKYEK